MKDKSYLKNEIIDNDISPPLKDLSNSLFEEGYQSDQPLVETNLE